MLKQKISLLLRRVRLIFFVDFLKFKFDKFKYSKKNKKFREKNPKIAFPPDYLMYESFKLDYEKYYFGGKETAIYLKNNFEQYTKLSSKNILDWGCGPGRIIRHFPEVVGNHCSFYGTDYNLDSIKWCKENLEGVKFNHNSIEAKLPYPNDKMDIIYGLSIFTHLSEKSHYDWGGELKRISKPGGILFLTTQGNNFKVKLNSSELTKFNDGQIVVRGEVKEGHRTFSAFHPPAFIKQLFHSLDLEILEHIERKPPESNGRLPQDIWIIRKK